MGYNRKDLPLQHVGGGATNSHVYLPQDNPHDRHEEWLGVHSQVHDRVHDHVRVRARYHIHHLSLPPPTQSDVGHSQVLVPVDSAVLCISHCISQAGLDKPAENTSPRFQLVDCCVNSLIRPRPRPGTAPRLHNNHPPFRYYFFVVN